MAFEQQPYHEILNQRLQHLKQHAGKAFNFQNLALACRVQKTYITRFFKGDAHLNNDQLYAACNYLKFSDAECSYIELLHAYERSAFTQRKTELKKQILKRAHELGKTQNFLSSQEIDSLTLSSKDISEYYLDPWLHVVHMFLTIPIFSEQPELLIDRLLLKKEHFNRILDKLLRLGIVDFSSGKCRVTKKNLHLDADNAIFPAYTRSMRLAALAQSERNQADDNYQLSVLFSATPEVKQQIKEKFLNFVKEASSLVESTETPNQVYMMNFDLLRF